MKQCWASLFTPRAIFYRFEKGLDAQKISVAVVVQNYLTSGNEVVSVRVDTNEPVAGRTATSEELQEELFGGSDDEDKPH